MHDARTGAAGGPLKRWNTRGALPPKYGASGENRAVASSKTEGDARPGEGVEASPHLQVGPFPIISVTEPAVRLRAASAKVDANPSESQKHGRRHGERARRGGTIKTHRQMPPHSGVMADRTATAAPKSIRRQSSGQGEHREDAVQDTDSKGSAHRPSTFACFTPRTRKGAQSKQCKRTQE